MAKRTTTKRSTRSTKPRQTQSRRQEPEHHDTDLHDLFLEEIADIYNAEQQLLKALPKMAQAAESDELREAMETHLHETELQIAHLEQAAESLGESIKRKTCHGMKGLLEEGQEIMREHKGSSALDAALINAAQKVEHYEIACYGTLCTWAKMMGHDEALDLLKENLSQEKATDEKLSGIAETFANERAQVS